MSFEGGEALRFNDKTATIGLQGILSVMRNIGMLENHHFASAKKKETFIARSSYWVRAPHSGTIKLKTKLGDFVKDNQVIGIISDPFGKHQFKVISKYEGIVIGLITMPLLNNGDAVAHIATFKNAEEVEETINMFEDGIPKIYRLGAITLEDIINVLPSIVYHENSSEKVLAPGMLPYHYSPNAKLYLVNDLQSALTAFKNKNIGVVTFSTAVADIEKDKLKVLSKNRNFKEASQKLYAALHELDDLNVECIIVEKFPEYDLGRTINNRLMKASKKQ